MQQFPGVGVFWWYLAGAEAVMTMTAVIDAKVSGRWWLWRWCCWHTSGVVAILRLILTAVDHAGRAYAAQHVERWHVEQLAAVSRQPLAIAVPVVDVEDQDVIWANGAALPVTA